MKCRNLYWSTLVVAALVATGTLASQEGAPFSSPNRIASEQEKMQRQQYRLLCAQAFPAAETEEEELRYLVEAQNFTEAELREKIERENSAGRGKEQKAEKQLKAKSVLSTTSHRGAYHSPYYVTPLGDVIFLEDESGWEVKYADRKKCLDWYQSDRIIITPNHEWFTSYDFKFHNENTGKSIRVKKVTYLGPNYNGLYTHWIIAIDYVHQKICLEDGSVWSVSVWDDMELKKMVVNDTVIIGTNDGWFQTTRPNILINLATEEFVKARCEY